MGKREDLLKKIADAQDQLNKLELEQKSNIRESAIKNLDEYTDEEKIKFFDKMYESALEELNRTEKENYHDEDSAGYAWEEYILILSKDKKLFWKYWNSLND